ncbi:MAG: hypothetical protein SGI91_08590 [Alphaproteobacteria bacterium]|mgnify:CR=1 FL=1|nr:hypothetical protein [Alphaproteobacteria bacterium]
MKLRVVAAIVLPMSTLLGCATLLEGTSQEILVSTNPSGATCTLEREGQVIATINATPGAALVKRRKQDITVRCKKDGFQEATYVNDSGLASGAVAGNVAADLLLTAGLSSIVDSASGADNQYENTVNVTMIPVGQAAAPVAPAPSAPAVMAPVADPEKPKKKEKGT